MRWRWLWAAVALLAIWVGSLVVYGEITSQGDAAKWRYAYRLNNVLTQAVKRQRTVQEITPELYRDFAIFLEPHGGVEHVVGREGYAGIGPILQSAFGLDRCYPMLTITVVGPERRVEAYTILWVPIAF